MRPQSYRTGFENCFHLTGTDVEELPCRMPVSGGCEIDRIVFDSGLVRGGAFRCHPDDPSFHDSSPSVVGDVDHDGHADLIVGAWQYSKEAIGAGRAYLYSGKDGHLINTFTCRIPGDTFGFDSVTMGDVDKDGTTDFLIISGWSGVHGFHSGRVFIISSGVKTK